MKPERRIYEHALKNLAVRPEECVYIDDIEKYVEAARKLGINGIHYTHGKDNLENQLKEVGVGI